MEITNRHNLPIEVYNALCKNRYNPDDESSGVKTDFSVSAIVAPTQQTILRKRYPDCNTEDCIDRVWSLFGHIAHALLEEHGSDGSITEKRFYATIHEKIISGQIDHYKDRRITDYKTTGVYKIKKGDFDEWQKQLNLYALLCEDAGYPVDTIRIIAIIRDWSEASTYELNYPQAPIVVLPLVKWSKEARRKYLNERVSLLLANERAKDEDLMPCTHKERWRDFAGYAVVKQGNTKASKVFKAITDLNKANAYAEEKGKGYSVETRYTLPRRCINFCNVSSKCHQFKKWKEEQSES